MEKETQAPVLILGTGNILLKDEGIGIHIIKELEKLPLPEGVELADGGTAGADLIGLLADRESVIVIDAVRADHSPGTILKLQPEDLAQPGTVLLSLHEVNLLDTLTMLEYIQASPGRVIIYGIVPGSMEPGLELTAETEAIVPGLVNLVLQTAGALAD